MICVITKYRKICVNRLLILLAPIVRLLESVQFNTKRTDVAPPIFIIGAPRTGSTILYQALTNAYQLAYIDNSTCTWHRNLRFGLWLSRKKYGSRPHNNFQSDHGNTHKFGGHAPSECGQFWYRWLPKDRHFIDHHEITTKMVTGLRQEVLGASAYLQEPLLFKNLNAGQRLRLIHKVFPDAKIIFVRRDPRFVTRSILKARDKVGAGKGQWWSIMPPNVSDLLELDESEMCSGQVYYLESQIEEDLVLFPQENVRQVHYQTFDENLIHDLGNWIGVSRRAGGVLPEFQHDDVDQLTPQEQAELATLVEKYPFKKELFV
ncbi:sulfotransferase [Marinobacter sp. GN3S48]|uniref:sulfotransferase n=1 Tax=Marinobacter sp. GN3S48 TaxID=3382302 RepID=UPI00387B6A9E